MRTLIVVIFFVACIVKAHAQLEKAQYLPYIKAASVVVNNPILKYDYKVLLADVKSGRNIDSIKGQLFKSWGNYLDSNTRVLNFVVNNYFFKADQHAKKVLFFDINALQRKLGLTPEDINTTLINVPDSLMFKLGNLNIDNSAVDLVVLQYNFKEPQNGMSMMEFYVTKKSLSLLQIKIVTLELDKWGEHSSGQSCTYILTNFSNSINTHVFQPDRYYKIENNQVKLKGRYHNFKLTASI